MKKVIIVLTVLCQFVFCTNAFAAEKILYEKPLIMYLTGVQQEKENTIIAKAKHVCADGSYMIHKYEIDLSTKNLVRFSTDIYNPRGKRISHVPESLEHIYGQCWLESTIADYAVYEFYHEK